jgi:hypothetical protein
MVFLDFLQETFQRGEAIQAPEGASESFSAEM